MPIELGTSVVLNIDLQLL